VDRVLLDREVVANIALSNSGKEVGNSLVGRVGEGMN